MLKHFRSGSKHVRTIWWVLTIGTVVAFIGGFIFIFGSGVGGGGGGPAPGPSNLMGRADGQPITYDDWQQALAAATAQFKNQYGTEAQGRDAAALQEQVWENLVTERVLDRTARELGIRATDPEVVFAARNTPPPDISSNPVFQTNGRFDPAKWRQAMADPSINWGKLEDRLRRILPAQKLEERVLAGAKFSEPELRRAFAERYDRVRATYAIFPLAPESSADTTRLSDTALRKYFAEHAAAYFAPAQAQAEVVFVPRHIGAEEERAALTEARAIAEEARHGADFAQLARERSEGPLAEKGGDLGRDLPIAQLPVQLRSTIDSLGVGGVTDPIRDGNTIYIFKVNARTTANGAPAVRLSQIQKPIKPSQTSEEEDLKLLTALRNEAAKGKLGGAAAKRNLLSVNTGWFAQNEFVQVLIQYPQLQQWALRSKKGEVSRIVSAETGWILAQVTDRREAGARSFEDMRAAVRRSLLLELLQQKPLAAAEQVRAAVRAGQSFEEAAKGAGATVGVVDSLSRSAPDPKVGQFPRALGLVFALAEGQVGPPVPGQVGVVLIRQDRSMPADPADFERVKGQLSQSLLQSRQQRYLKAWMDRSLKDAQVQDLRGAVSDEGS